MGRKRNQGKARRAAKAKAREEAANQIGSGHSNDRLSTLLTIRGTNVALHVGGPNDEGKCKHGLFDPDSTDNNLYLQFISAFTSSFHEAIRRSDGPVSDCLIDARNATLDEFSNLWKDPAKLETVMPACLCVGTDAILEGEDYIARLFATPVRFFEQYIAVELKQTQAVPNWPKIEDTYHADDHSLVKFFRNRIPCSCMDKKYQDVKSITKLSTCYNPKCSNLGVKVERSKAKYCSRCRCATYCSRECQGADWAAHAPNCDDFVAMTAEFEAKQQNKSHRG